MDKGLKAYVAEAIGTFALVFFAVGVAIVYGEIFATALAFGLVIVVMATVIGDISGCHINPAVSLACLIAKRMSIKDFVCYVVAQIIGGLLGALFLFGILKMSGYSEATHTHLDFAGSNHLINDFEFGSIALTIVLELLLTFVFIYVILFVTDEKKGLSKVAGVLIGLTLLLVHLIGIPLTGTSVNPSRSIATAFGNLIFEGELEPLKELFAFIVAPLAGGALAAVVYNAINKKKANSKEEKVEEINSDDAAEETKAE